MHGQAECVTLASGKIASFIEHVLINHQRKLKERGNGIVSNPVAAMEFSRYAAIAVRSSVENLSQDPPPADHNGTSEVTRLGTICLSCNISQLDLVEACTSLFDETLLALEDLGEAIGIQSTVPLASIRVTQHGMLINMYTALTSYEAARGDLVHELRLADRRRVARDLHDKIGSGIALAIRYLDMMELKHNSGPEAVTEITRVRESLEEVLETTRSIVSAMRNAIPPGSLERELRIFSKNFATTGAAVDITVYGDDITAPPDFRDELFIILREALRNALMHAFPRKVVVRVFFSDTRIVGVVEDDGVGFTKDADLAARPGHGLTSMRERAGALGGNAEITSRPGRGTRVAVTLPVPGNYGERSPG